MSRKGRARITAGLLIGAATVAGGDEAPAAAMEPAAAGRSTAPTAREEAEAEATAIYTATADEVIKAYNDARDRAADRERRADQDPGQAAADYVRATDRLRGVLERLGHPTAWLWSRQMQLERNIDRGTSPERAVEVFRREAAAYVVRLGDAIRQAEEETARELGEQATAHTLAAAVERVATTGPTTERGPEKRRMPSSGRRR